MAIFFLERGTISVLINNETGLWWAYRSKNDNHQSKVVCVDQAELLSQLIDRAYQSSAEKMYAILLNYSIEKRPVDLRYLILNVTSNCNLRCEYCYAKEQKKQDHMSYEVMSSAIENFYAATEGAASRVIAFHGGEPLLHYGEILRVVDKFKCNRTHFLIQTNGTLLSNDLIQELRLRDIEVGITIDSIDEKKTSLRSNEDNYTQKVFYNLKKAAEMGVAQSVLSIIQEGNVSDLISMTRVFNSLGISVVAYNLLWPTEVQLLKHVVNNDQLISASKDLYDYIQEKNYTEGFETFEKYRERNLYELWRRVFYARNDYMCMNAPCGAGKAVVTVDETGDIYPCSLTLSISGVPILGNIKSEKIHQFSHQPERCLNNVEKCKNCPFKFTCGGGGCTGLIWKVTGDINGNSLYCNYYYEMIIFMMERAFEHANVNSLTNINFSSLTPINNITNKD